MASEASSWDNIPENVPHIHITDMVSSSDLAKISEVLDGGGVIVYPTETVYGLGAEFSEKTALEKLFAIKGRAEDQPFSIATILEKVKEYAYISESARIISDHYLPGPLTLVMRKKPIVPNELTGNRDTIGIRVSSHPALQSILHWIDTAIVSTSANLSGESAPTKIEELNPQLLKQVDLIVTSSSDLEGTPSTVIETTQNPVELLREGAIRFADITNLLRKIKITK